MTDVHQCPGCELRFRYKTELEYHWREDHEPLPEVEPEPGVDRAGDEEPEGRVQGNSRAGQG